MRLGEATWTEARDAIGSGAAAIIPLGSIEEHGPHVPMGDYFVVDEVAGRTGEATGDLVAPTIPVGYSEYFRHYPGTITFRPETLAAVIEDVVSSLVRHGISHIAIFNGHAGNAPIIELVTRRLRREIGLLIPSISPFQIMLTPSIVEDVYGAARELAHGGEPMGSLMMALKPGRVDLSNAGEFGRGQVLGLPTDGLGALRLENVRIGVPIDMREVAPESGSLGDPAGATAEKGAAILSQTVEACVGFMNWFRSVDPTVVKE